MDKFLSLEQGAEASVVEKKSRFIAQASPVYSEEDALSFIEKIKKKHYDARHNCYAYSVGAENLILRFSDDGEPQGTAGKPIADVISGAGIHNICIVVTRYFGGTLLGTGGLCRAYTAAAKEAVSLCTTKVMRAVLPVDIRVDYGDLSKVQHILDSADACITDREYGTGVVFHSRLPFEAADGILDRITEATGGRAAAEKHDKIYA